MREFDVEIEGVTGLLQHRNTELYEQATNGVKPTSRAKSTPDEQAVQSAYKLEDGSLYQPSEHLYQSFVKAATGFQVVGGGKKTYKDAIKGGLLISPDCIPHNTREYEIDKRPVRVQTARVMRGRAMLPKWKLAFRVTLIDDGVPAEVLNQIIVKAGTTIGIGDYRPRFGRFIVTKFEAV